MTDVIATLISFAAGAIIAASAMLVTRRAESRIKRLEADLRSMRGRSSGVSLSVASLLDPTGASTYALLRRDLAVGYPDRSPAQSFRESARTISEAYPEAVSDHQHTGAGNGSL